LKGGRHWVNLTGSPDVRLKERSVQSVERL